MLAAVYKCIKMDVEIRIFTMTNKKEFVEYRKDERIKVKAGAIVTITIGENTSDNFASKYIQKGQIINISKRGLAFRYTDRNSESNEPFELDIIFSQDIISVTYLKDVPFKTVWVSNEDSKPSFGHLKIKQRGVQFGELMPNQKNQLDCFLQKYAVG